MKFNWQQAGWPGFRYDAKALLPVCGEFAARLGALRALVDTLPAADIGEQTAVRMADEAVGTSTIEGVVLSRAGVLSSVCRLMGRHAPDRTHGTAAERGAAAVVVDARRNFAKPLDAETLVRWQRLFLEGLHERVTVGVFRHGPVYVVKSNGLEQEVLFEAPPAKRVPAEIKGLVAGFNGSAATPSAIRAALAHIRFESIHPFDDGNGRVGRTLVAKAVAQALERPVILPLSDAILADRKAYYAAINAASRSLDMTDWIDYFTRTLVRACDDFTRNLMFVSRKNAFLGAHKAAWNPRQLKAVTRMLAEGPAGFVGGMTAEKYMAITKASKATATRDLSALAAQGVLVREGAGRSAHYRLEMGLLAV